MRRSEVIEIQILPFAFELRDWQLWATGDEASPFVACLALVLQDR